MVHSGVLFKFLADGGPPNVARPGIAPYPALSTGLATRVAWRHTCMPFIIISERQSPDPMRVTHTQATINACTVGCYICGMADVTSLISFKPFKKRHLPNEYEVNKTNLSLTTYDWAEKVAYSRNSI